MKRKKYILSLIIVGISLVIGLIAATSVNSKNRLQAKEIQATSAITDNIFQSVRILVPAETSRVLEQEDYLKNDSEVKVTMTFKFTNKDYKVGDTYETTLPEGLTYVQVIEGSLSDTATYRIDPTTRKLTLTMVKDVQSAEYKLDLTTRIKFDSTKNSKQTMLFETQTPTNYIFHLYEQTSPQYRYGKTFNKEGEEDKLMPTTGGQFDTLNINYAHADLAKANLEVSVPKKVLPSYWSDGYVDATHDLESFQYYTYETMIDGTQVGEKKELKINEDFVIIKKTETTYQIQFKERFHEALEVSGGEIDFGYSDFNPISNGRSGSVTFPITFMVYPSATSTSFLSYGRFSVNFFVVELGYLGLGTIIADTNVKENEMIVKTPVYINGTNQDLKKGDTFKLTNEGNPALVAINTKLSQEYKVTFNANGSIVEGSKSVLKNWEITSDAFGEVTLTYLGEDTTETFGLDLYMGMDETVTTPYNSKFVLSGNGYQTNGTTTFKGQANNIKSGSFNTDKNVITWTATINSLYQKITKITDTFGEGVKAGTLKNIKISSVEFGKNGAKKDLIEGTDYEVIDSSDSFEIKFLKEVREKLTISYETGVDLATIDQKYSRATNTITPKLVFDSSVEKEFPTLGSAYIPSYLTTNSAFLLGKNSYSGTTEKIKEQPVNQVKLLINPAGANLSNNEVVINYKSLDVSILDKKFTVNKIKQFSTTEYGNLLPDEEITSENEEYPEIIVEDNQIRVKNKKLTQPIIVSFTLAKNNYYNAASDYVAINQTNDNFDPVNSNSQTLYFNNTLAKSFTLKTSETYANIGEGTLTVDKNNGFALIKGTKISFATIIPANDSKELPSLREITDGAGNPLPASTVSVSGGGYSDWSITINDDSLKNGLIVKMKWTFNTSGSKSYSGGSSSHPYTNSRGSISTQSYLYYSWSGKFDIDNSGAGGEGNLVLKDVTINMVDSVTNKALAGATYEILDKSGKLVDTVTSNTNGQILLKDYVVTNYTLKEIKAPDGYLSNDEYNEAGKEITLTPTGENKLTIPYIKEGKIIVHFTYQDGTDIETVTPITLTGGNGSIINLKEQAAVTDQIEQLNLESSDFRFLNYDSGKAGGTETAVTIPYDTEAVYYKYEGLLSLKVPELLTFETGFVSPFKQVLSYENTNDFEVALRDNRQITSSATTKPEKTRGNIRLNAFLSKEFTTQENKVLKNARLIYQNGTEDIILNGTGGELVNNKQDAGNAAKKDFNFILDTAETKNQGFKLEVPAKGTLADEYTGEVTWEIIQEP
ncbi:SpaA isopeptide-forming pilin-related protein [Enterococcus sp. 5H]|uniref:SpaA isopeptide-forming pilin-related protein n=1 Tax=Enterococcus sp. 5H TaxID=1229490 RepID=UPI00230211F7|nr:SpaA isopeptide-forming pilin-related protein [Enterococcus sp. 5H]MDA9470797.1 putative LPXTG-motif-containing peptidoglycan bound protein [Enterococcus sp. 5H]